VSKAQRDKGARREREMVAKHVAIGVKAERVPLSGAAHYKSQGHDIDIYTRGNDAAPMIAEVKARKDGGDFKTIKRWLGENDALFLIEDRAEPLIVVPWRVWAELLVGREA